ncbi:hypothetical protein TcasGA2_TC001082 [Tribolium castaneum]|uniref:Uncharacterized protein n=1 Tax=Tribolium castaneum TaxID=7070 RepID=D6WA09_TRICA|nr:hypothetical protein TcasGA2_TC001082 [Tribolium castaneum]
MRHLLLIRTLEYRYQFYKMQKFKRSQLSPVLETRRKLVGLSSGVPTTVIVTQQLPFMHKARQNAFKQSLKNKKAEYKICFLKLFGSFEFGDVCVNLKTVGHLVFSVFRRLPRWVLMRKVEHGHIFEKSPSKFKTKIFEFSTADVTNKELRIGVTGIFLLRLPGPFYVSCIQHNAESGFGPGKTFMPPRFFRARRALASDGEERSLTQFSVTGVTRFRIRMLLFPLDLKA